MQSASYTNGSESIQGDLDSGDVEEDWFAEDTDDVIDELEEQLEQIFLPSVNR